MKFIFILINVKGLTFKFNFCFLSSTPVVCRQCNGRTSDLRGGEAVFNQCVSFLTMKTRNLSSCFKWLLFTVFRKSDDFCFQENSIYCIFYISALVSQLIFMYRWFFFFWHTHKLKFKKNYFYKQIKLFIKFLNVFSSRKLLFSTGRFEIIKYLKLIYLYVMYKMLQFIYLQSFPKSNNFLFIKFMFSI